MISNQISLFHVLLKSCSHPYPNVVKQDPGKIIFQKEKKGKEGRKGMGEAEKEEERKREEREKERKRA